MLSVITEIAELEDLRAEWSELWASDPRATPFQSPEWLLAWWHHLFAGGQLWALVQRDGDRLISLLPLFRYGSDRETLAMAGAGVTDYLDILGESIETIPGDWLDGTLEEIRPESPLLRCGVPEPCSVCPVIDLPSSMPELIDRIDPKLAIDIRRSSNRLNRAGNISIERTNDIGVLFDLHRARWKERNEAGMLAGVRLQAFHREVAAGFDRLGILRLYRLLIDEVPAAVIYAFTHRQRTYAYLSGFAPQLAKLSPGTVLLAHVIEDAIQEGVRKFDFLRNPEAYKYKWAAKDQPTYRIQLTKRAPGPVFRD